MRGIEQYLQVDAATLGALKYAGTWNASTNTPTLTSGVGTQGQYYVVSVAGSTNLDGETNWQVGDWAVFNGSVWQKVDGGSTGLLSTLTVTGNTYLATTSGNVGVGTSSPTNKLHIVGSGDILRFTNGTVSLYGYSDSAGLGWFTGTVGTNVGVYYNNTSSYQSFYTSSTERIRITSAGDVGIGTSSPASKLHVVGDIQQDNANYIKGKLAAGTATRLFGLNAANSLYIGGIDASQSETLFTRGGTTQMTLDASGNLGIGVSTPSTYGKLVVWGGNAFIQSTTAGVGSKITLSDTNNSVSIESSPVGGATDMVFKTSALTRMNLDNAGNLGLGVTPSAWRSNTPAFQVGVSGGASLFSDSGVTAAIGNNMFLNASSQYIYQRNDASSYYQQYQGAHAWFNAPSGTAGNAISFTQAMTLDASGNLGIGTSSPWSQLTVGSGGTANPASTVSFHKGTVSEYRLKLTSSLFNSDGAWLGLGFGYSDNYMKAAIIAEAKDANARANLHFALNDATSNANASLSDSKMVLTYAGNLGLGVTPSAWSGIKALEFGGGNFIASNGGNGVWQGNNCYYNGANWIYKATAAASYSNQVLGAHAWYTAPSGTAGNAISFTQAMTLDASGNLGIGTTSPNTRLEASGSEAIVSLRVNTNNSGVSSGNYSEIQLSDLGSVRSYWRNVRDGSGKTVFSYNDHLAFLSVSGTERLRITSAGNIHTPAGATTMTDGFFYIPAAAGVPTGVPTAITGTVPMYYDTTNNKFYVYNGAWKSVTLT